MPGVGDYKKPRAAPLPHLSSELGPLGPAAATTISGGAFVDTLTFNQASSEINVGGPLHGAAA